MIEMLHNAACGIIGVKSSGLLAESGLNRLPRLASHLLQRLCNIRGKDNKE
jgi:hypothetical protein